MDPLDPKHPAVPAFDDGEVARILARATELDALAPGSPLLPAGTGERRLSLTDLESVAIEAGIDPHHLRTAASEVVLQRRAPPAKVTPVKAPLGLANRVELERVVAVALDEDGWGRVVQELREHTGAPGVMTTLAGRRKWHSKAEGGAGTVALRAEALPTGGTRFAVSRNTSASAAMAMTLGMSFALMCLVLLVLFLVVPPADGLAGLPAVLGMVAGAGALVTGGTVVAGHRHLKTTDAKLGALLDRVELLALRGDGGDHPPLP